MLPPGLRHIPSVCGGSGSSIPSWVLSGAAIDIDFANARVFGGTLASLLSITRASSKTDLLPASASGATFSTFGVNTLAITAGAGLLIEEARTNSLLNSTAPATQTTASLGTGTYTLWVNGAGSAAPSAGTATITGAGTATNGSPNVIQVTVAGTVTVTVTGALNAFQLEAGAFGTSLIVTAGATATRSADTVTATGALLTTINSDPIWVLGQTGNVQNWAANAVIVASFPSFTRGLLQTNSGASNQLVSFDGVSLTATAGSGNFLGSAKSILTGGSSGRSLAINNGAVATDLGQPGTPSTNMALGALSGTSRFLDGYISRLTVGRTRLTNAAAQALTA